MAAKFYVLAIVSVVAGAAPPTYRQQEPAQLQEIPQFEYYLGNQDNTNYYGQTQQRQASNNGQRGAPSRLETLEPDSEVELIPGAQQPQQPPQQNPVAPNLPGLVPGQRVFIVHMPVPGYRPGSIGGYQPVYIVAAAPQTNAGYPPNVINGYQNAVLLDPSGQAVYPLAPRTPAYLLAPQLHSLKAPYDALYQQPIAYQQAQPLGAQETRRPIHLSQLIALQNANAENNPRSSSSSNESSSNAASESTESKETEEQRHDMRALPRHAQNLKAQ